MLLVHLYDYLACVTFCLFFLFGVGGWLWPVIVVIHGLFF